MSQIGRYEIVRQTGNHGLGSLYQAFDPVMHRAVTIRIADGDTSQARQEILLDAKQLAHLDHPNIIKFLACEEDDGRPYLVMERFEGKPIARLSRERLARVLKKAALALDHAHSKGLIHRNLTPESLLLDDDETLKITGFEIARPAQYLNSGEADAELDLLLDSIHYMSPELVKGDVLDGRSDQYSLGVIAWKALTGELPFHSDSPITLLENIAFEPPELRGASAALMKVFARVFAKSPDERFATSSEFAVAFENSPVEVEAIAPVVVPLRPEPLEEKKSLLPWIIGAIAVVVFAVVAAIVMSRPARNGPPAVKTAPAPEIVPAPPVTDAPVKAKAAKKLAPVKDTTPEAPRLKPLDPKVVHQ